MSAGSNIITSYDCSSSALNRIAECETHHVKDEAVIICRESPQEQQLK